ncbi:MAG: hypothetical protein HY241_13280 [Actinobacteria bacterium]|nr:hypothetical protein [Actinomycetota bacterium]
MIGDTCPPERQVTEPAEPTDDGGSGGEVAAAMAAALAALEDLAASPVGLHVERYDALHGTLQDALASIDQV